MTIANGSLAEVTLNMQLLGQRIANVFQYEMSAIAGGITAANLAEGWWNDVKATYRALAVTGSEATFLSVGIRELNNPTGDLAEFPVPTGEQQGTRSAGSLGNFMPSYAAVGVRFAVSTRATRPGQKRVPFVTEGDTASNLVGSDFISLVNAWATNITNQIIAGSPALGATFTPIVCRKDTTSGDVLVHQPVTGFLVNSYITSQVSRRAGRGS